MHYNSCNTFADTANLWLNGFFVVFSTEDKSDELEYMSYIIDFSFVIYFNENYYSLAGQ